MRILFSPQRSDVEQPAVEVAGDVLTINAEVLDFSPLEEGDTLPAEATGSPWIVGAVTRAGGDVQVTLRLPHGATAPEETRFPQPADVVSGPVPLPPYNAPEEPAND